MGKAFDIGLERLLGGGVVGVPDDRPLASRSAQAKARFETQRTPVARGTFYLETFGCQMNEHDSEKVAGVLLARGYKQVERLDAADVVLYNTCSIREKAAQKVFSRLGELRPAQWTLSGRAWNQPLKGVLFNVLRP